MLLTKEQLTKLQQKLVVGKCPNCGYEGTKSLNPEVYTLPSITIEGRTAIIEPRTPYLPLVSAHCPQCGYAMLFNLVALGIVESK